MSNSWLPLARRLVSVAVVDLLPEAVVLWVDFRPPLVSGDRLPYTFLDQVVQSLSLKDKILTPNSENKALHVSVFRIPKSSFLEKFVIFAKSLSFGPYEMRVELKVHKNELILALASKFPIDHF
jgi:hypothetical protein